jgi:hypothetical protein
MRRNALRARSAFVTLSKMARRVPAAKLLPAFRVTMLTWAWDAADTFICLGVNRALFMRQLASGYRPTSAYLTSYFDDDTFIRFQVYRSIYFSWPAIQAAG